ncbi:methyltransferase, FkbM family/amino acid adenylation domain-containing protein [Amycolatopsis marina]|uniref:Methyltransferase, FkbM family/amino acid adenylation domain-containing protein n=1 Tax=Amycolatopsis marina TaxID=490629 RepID=A0A1I0V6Y7_9PSEU|nr:non-ribosomal peptide synthetase [Amycolatopsis marina]SFA72048.1 methyltransferase, FkbM family/amino acid adenylation domain-containing protein [Amycolatopsis marina]
MSTVADIYPLSPLQQGLLFHVSLRPDSGAYLQQVTVSLSGPLSVSRLRRSWEHVVERHAALRTGFVWEGLEEPLQVVSPPGAEPWADTRWAEYDWSDSTGDELDRRLGDFLAEDRARGFPLTAPPLLRLTLLRTGADEHLLVWTVHHLVIDGWSVPLVLADVAACYRGEQPQAQPRAYREFIAWQRDHDLAEADEFWRKELAGFTAPTVLDLGMPDDGSPADEEAAAFGDLVVELSADTTAALAKTARQEQLTLNSVIQGCWALVLSVYARESDVVFGATVSGRPPELAGVDSMVGMFINSLPVRARIDGSLPVAEWLRALQVRQSQARQFEHTPLVRIQSCGEVPGGTPLFETLIGVENYPLRDTELAAPGDTVPVTQRLRGGRFYTHYPLTLLFVPGDRLAVQALYDQRRFGGDAVRTLVQRLCTVLEQVAVAPERLVREVSLADPDERCALAARGADPRPAPRTGERTLVDLVAASIASRGAAEAVVCGEDRLSYAELDRRAGRLARRLRARGCGRGDVVAVCAPRSPELVIALLAVLRSGAAYLPLDPDNPSDRLDFLVADSGAGTVVLHPEPAARFPRLAAGAVLLGDETEGSDDTAADTATNVSASRPGPDDLAYVIYTSGSTGKPKGVEVTHRNVVSLLESTRDEYGFGSDDTWTMFHSAAFDFSVWELWGALGHAGRVVVVPFEISRSPERFAELLVDEGVTVLNQTPSAFRPLAETLVERGDTGSLRLVIFGGEALDVADLRQWFATFGDERPVLVNMYGITEATVHVTQQRLSPKDADLRPHSIGRPLPCAGVYVTDVHGNLVPDGVLGEMWISGTGVARGYRGRPELTAQRFVPDRFAGAGTLYRSGDLARYLPDGTLEFRGRGDDQVQVRGFRVELGEIETVLAGHPGIDEAAVVQRGNGDLAAYLVPSRRHALPVRRLIELSRAQWDATPSEMEPVTVDLPNGATVFAANVSETDFMAREIFTDRTYLQGGIVLPDNACVVDVGANIGLFGVFVAEVCRDPVVFALEPLPPLQELLRRNLYIHDVRGAVLPFGAGAEESTVEFSYYPHATVLSGRYAESAADSGMVKSFLVGQLASQGVQLDEEVIDELLIERLGTQPYTCRVRPLGAVLAEHDITHVDLLKIDVEKSELDVLAGLSDEDFSKIDQIVIEVHDQDGRLEVVRDLLHSKGYRSTVLRDPQLSQTELYNVYASRLPMTAADRGEPGRHPGQQMWRARTALLSDVRAAAAEELPYYMLPVSWTLLDGMPLTTNGKRDLTALPDPDAGAPTAGFVAPRTGTERSLAAIWADILGRDRVGAEDNFFAVGGHSLLATRVIGRIRGELGVRLPLADVFAKPTLAALAEAVDRALLERDQGLQT